MTKLEFSTDLDLLREGLRSNASVESLEDNLASVMSYENPQCIGKLLMCLDDNYIYQEFMWSILHSVESFQIDVYVRELVKFLPMVRLKAPEWAVTLLLRILNSEEHDGLLLNQFEQWPAVGKDIYNNIITEIERRLPGKFDNQIAKIKISLFKN